jgi:tetratricopeptide (TPR) repeat protein/transcriptional regulator with XRE-family HTH domain
VVAIEPAVESFAGLLRRLRAEAGLTQEELAEAAGVGGRTVSDLERGVALTARKETARLLATALGLEDAARASFEAAARGRSPAPASSAAATRTLPRDIASFTGREPELRQLTSVITGAGNPGGVVSIHAIGGMAGIGKTAFAVHAAHRLADRFPGGQIFLPLHGHTPGHPPVMPEDALASLLLTAGVPASHIPPGVEARMALWRDRLAGKQLLLVLDDAASSEQVRPLLPGAGSSLVLVTSRRHLSALEDATALSLDTLPAGEAAGLLVRLAGRAGLSPDDPAVAEITSLCGFLPLAIGMVARQLHHHPAWTVAGRAAELAAARNRLELMHAENLSVAAAFNLSYEDLAPGQQQLFRRLGLHPGNEIDVYAAAALDGTDLDTARRQLDALYDHYLIGEPTRGRYRLHDLIREHARALADRVDPDRDGSVARLLDYYEHAAARAGALIGRRARPARPAPAAAERAVPAAVPALADAEHALAWTRAERASLLACLDHAAGTGQYARVIALAAGLAGLLRLDGPWAEAITRHTAAVQAARSLGDRLGEANALGDLGDVQGLAGEYPAAAQALEQALAIYRDLGDRLGQANALRDLGYARGGDDYPAAAQALEQALAIYRDLGDRLGQADVLTLLGILWLVTGDLRASARAEEQALAICRDLGDRLGQAGALAWLGFAWQAMGQNPAAAQAAEQALAIYRDISDQAGHATALSLLGEVRREAGDYPAAIEALEQAMGIFSDIGHREYYAQTLAYLGEVRRATGQYPAAAHALEQALAISRDIGDRGGEARVLNQRGTLHRVSGDLAQADACHQDALRLARAIGSPWDEAHALAGLGRCALAEGRTAEAEGKLRPALEIFQRIGAAEAANVTTELDACTEEAPGREQPPAAT